MSAKIVPYVITDQGVHILKKAECSQFFRDLEYLSSLLIPENLETVWQTFADLWYESSFSSDFMQYQSLISSPALLEVIAERLKTLALQVGGPVGLGFRLAAMGAKRIKHWVPESLVTDRKSAAIFRNRFDTLAHRELILTALERIMNGKIGDSPEWALQLLHKWKVFGDN